MPPPEVNTDGSSPESDAVTTPETQETASGTQIGVPGDGDGDARPRSDHVRERRMQRQRRMKQAWRKLVDSFDEVFYTSDENDQAGPEQSYRRSPKRGYSDNGSRHPPSRRRVDHRYKHTSRGPPSASDPYDKNTITRSRSVTRSRPVDLDGMAPVEPILESKDPALPISFVTELYDYSEASPVDEYEEAYLKTSFERDVPTKVVEAKAVGQPAAQGLVFKLVTMYAVPRARKRGHRRNRYYAESLDDQGSDYLPHPEKSLGVMAELGTCMIITSQAVLKALRTIISSHPDLPRLAESITIPEPFCFIVQYKKEIEDYLAKLPVSPEPDPVSGQQPLPAQTQTAGIQNTMAGVADTTLVEVAPASPLASSKRAEFTEEQQERHDLQILMEHTFRDEFGRRYDAETALHAETKCTYDLAWMLFRPGSYVYSWEGDSLNCYIVESVELEGLFAKRTRSNQAKVRPRNRFRGQAFNFSRTPESIVVKMCYLEFDGEYIGRRLKKVAISPFEGEKDINALPVFPLEYCIIDDIRQKLISRGKRYIELTKRTYAEYDGETLSIPQRSVRSRIMVDSRTFYNDRDIGMAKVPKLKVPKEEGAISSPSTLSDASDDSLTPNRVLRSLRIHKRKIRDLKRRPHRNTILTEHDLLNPEDTDFKDEQYMLLTQRIYGFILKERIWDLLDVSSIKEPSFQEDMINDLVLEDEAKKLVQALSNSHALAAKTGPHMQQRGFGDVGGGLTTWSADFVHNKGEGRIFLLHGKPGVGKTTTAECIAEQSRSPLLSITCGDLGIHPDEVEENLMKWLKLATLWRAVLLLDEADVYLESRVSGDLQRNSLVSIFLRALEYYQGLLFLTTNRIGTFDEALISRVHVVLHYPDFTDEQRQTIWQTSFRKLDAERPDIKIGPGVVDYALEHEDLKRVKWNGREIRNAFNTIVALAEFDAEKKRRLKPGEENSVIVRLERSHLKQVVEMSWNFKEYMRRTKGMDESKFQHVSRVRDGDGIKDNRDPKTGHKGDIPKR